MAKQVTEPTAKKTSQQELTVQYWRSEFNNLFTQFESLAQLRRELAGKDILFADVVGFDRLRNVKRGKGSLVITARAVELMRELRPASSVATKPTNRTGRQNISRL